MPRFIKSRKETIGLAPDAIFFRGEKKLDSTRLRIIDYNATELIETEPTSLKEIAHHNNTSTTTWLNIDGLHDEDLMMAISQEFELDPLILADVLHTHGRPKIHEYDNCVFISLRMLNYDEEKESISNENISIIIKENILLSFQERQGDIFDPVRERIRKQKKLIRNSGTDYLAFALLDVIIDNYIHVISRIGEKIELIDEELMNPSAKTILDDINNYKGEINYLRKTIKPAREMILNLVKLDSDFINEDINIHLKELQDNINLSSDSLDSYREILSDQLSIFHTNVSNRLNDILKFLTIFSVIFIPITFIAGIYGTNFEYIPELRLKYGYFMMWGVIILTVAGMITYFKRQKWI